MYALHINIFIVFYLLGHYVKYISSCGQGQKKLDPLHQSVLLVRRYLGAFIPTPLPLFLDDSNHERVRSSACCRATHMSFPPDLIYPVCSYPVNPLPLGTEPRSWKAQALVWAPGPTHGQGQRAGRADRPTAKPMPILWLVKSGSATFTAEQRTVRSSTAKLKKCPETILAPLGHTFLPLRL